MTITTQGRRDLILYTSDAEGALRRVESIRAGIESHQIEMEVERDTFWGMYRSFHEAATSSSEPPA
jgi:hypothetical protein